MALTNKFLEREEERPEVVLCECGATVIATVAKVYSFNSGEVSIRRRLMVEQQHPRGRATFGSMTTDGLTKSGGSAAKLLGSHCQPC
jgi:hypothetical protein